MFENLTKQEVVNVLYKDDIFDHLEPCLITSLDGKSSYQFDVDGGYIIHLIEHMKTNVFPITADHIDLHTLKNLNVIRYHNSLFIFKDNQLFKYINVYELGNINVIPEMDLITAAGKDNTIAINTDGVVVENSI